MPVDPAATSTPCGGDWIQRSASRSSNRTRRWLTSTTPRASRRTGQSVSALSRKLRDTSQWAASSATSTRPASRPPISTPSICRPSRKLPRASASSSAAEAEESPAGTSSLSSATNRVSSNRRLNGSMAAGRSRARSPGSNGASPASRSPSGRIWGGITALPPETLMKASAKARTPRRVGVSTTTSARASGPSGESAS